MPVKGFNHLNIRTPNFAQSAAFMAEVLGMSVVPVPGQTSIAKAAWILDADGMAVIHMASADIPYAKEERLPQVAPRGSGAIHHVALTCTDFAAMKARLTVRGIAFRENYPASGVSQIFVEDPSDITFELNFSDA
jgi:catechol 2,3-dioxygenase-like lactoylglutathione lyase family enzyme